MQVELLAETEAAYPSAASWGEQEEYLTQAEAARMARASKRWLQVQHRDGTGPPVLHFGTRKALYPRAAFVAWLNSHVRPNGNTQNA